MLQDIKHLYGRKLGATDGEIGQVKDFYFDDDSWAVRYLMVDTGSWLAGRQVLLTPHAFSNRAFGRPNADSEVLHVNLTRKQIEASPSIDTHRPISRQHEIEYYNYYGWPIYWQDAGMGLSSGVSLISPAQASDARPHHGHNQRDDLHLRNTKAVTGYQIHATDGVIGSVSSFMLDGKDWTICKVVVEAGHWYAGKTILLLPKNISRISYDESTVFVNLSIEEIRKTAPHHVAKAVAV